MTQPTHNHFTRRDALQFSLSALGVGFGMMGCSRSPPDGPVEKLTAGSFFSIEEMRQLAEIAEIIIPATDTPGAREANVHGFIDRMMAEWALPETQNAFRAVLREIDSSAKIQFGGPFLGLSPEQRVDVVTAMDLAAFELAAQGGSASGSAFVRLKRLVLLGYYHSKVGATEELQFQLVPGRYMPCAPLTEIGRAWASEPINNMSAYGQILGGS